MDQSDCTVTALLTSAPRASRDGKAAPCANVGARRPSSTLHLPKSTDLSSLLEDMAALEPTLALSAQLRCTYLADCRCVDCADSGDGGDYVDN